MINSCAIWFGVSICNYIDDTNNIYSGCIHTYMERIHILGTVDPMFNSGLYPC